MAKSIQVIDLVKYITVQRPNASSIVILESLPIDGVQCHVYKDIYRMARNYSFTFPMETRLVRDDKTQGSNICRRILPSVINIVVWENVTLVVHGQWLDHGGLARVGPYGRVPK